MNVCEFAGGNVRVEVLRDRVRVVLAHGAYLPDEIEPAMAYAERYTGGVDALITLYADDKITGDDQAVVMIYERRGLPVGPPDDQGRLIN